MTQALPVSRLVNVQVVLTPRLADFPNLSTCLLLGTSTVIDVQQRMRSYSTLAEVAADFGTSAEEYLAAVPWFGQSPAPTNLLIGRWAKTASHGQLVGGPVSAANRLIGAWTGITTGSLTVHVDGGGAKNLTGLDFHLQTNLNGVASVITTALGVAMAGASVAWDANQGRFVWTSATTGATSTVSFLTPEGAGVDITGMLAGLAADGAYVADGVAAQGALATYTIFNDRFSSQFYALVMPDADDAEHLAVAEAVEAADPPHFYGITSDDTAIITADDTSSIAYLLQQEEVDHAAVQYSSTSAYAIMSLLARILTTNWSASLSTITLMYKQEPLITAEQLSTTEMDALLAVNANVYVAYNNSTTILQPGICPSGQFVDSVIGTDWLRGAIQTNIYNILFGTSTKIPQTDAGMNQIATQVQAACVAGVNNGLIAPGTWNAGGFGQIKQGDFLPLGYYIYTPPVSSQSEADRQARRSVPIQVAVKLAGAVHTVQVTVNVNQ